MADQGKWFKLWCSSLHDESLENMSLEDWARWARLGAYIKEHGRDGMIRFAPPYRALLNLFRVTKIDEAIVVLHEFPNCVIGERKLTVSTETNAPVSFEIQYKNWFKFQGDFSSGRVRKFRDKKRHYETLQEEKRSRRDVDKKRQEEKRTTTPSEPTRIASQANPETAAIPKPYRLPEKEIDPTGYLVMQFKIRKIGQDAFDDREWDERHWARVSASAKALLKITGGIDDAKQCLGEIGEEFDKKGLSWTLETVVKWAHEWRKKGHGLSDSKRFLDALSRQRKDSGPSQVRELTPAGQGFAGMGDNAPLQHGTTNANGAGGSADA